MHDAAGTEEDGYSVVWSDEAGSLLPVVPKLGAEGIEGVGGAVYLGKIVENDSHRCMEGRTDFTAFGTMGNDGVRSGFKVAEVDEGNSMGCDCGEA